jgi:hypothetical protein
MFQFDSNLSFYIPVVFPKYANRYFIKEAFEEAHIGMVRRIELSKNGNHYKAYIYFDWVENDMSHGIQKQILGKHKQTFFTFNHKIRNGYWIVKKNVEVLSYNELYKRYNTQRNTISHFLKEIQIKNEQLELKNKKIREKEAEILEKENEVLEKEKEIRLKEIENDNDVDFFETKICQMKQRIEDLETHYYNNYISSDDEEEDASEADSSEADSSEADSSEADSSEADSSEADSSEADSSEADSSEAENEEVEEAKDKENEKNDVEKNDVEKNDVEKNDVDVEKNDVDVEKNDVDVEKNDVEKNENYEYDFDYDNDDEFMLI